MTDHPISASAQDLHGAIMNLPISSNGRAISKDPIDAYRMGFKDARHAAAELVIAASPAQVEQPVEGRDVFTVNCHVSAEFDLPIGFKLYPRPQPMGVLAWLLLDRAGNVAARESTCIKAWARIDGYKPTVEGLLGYEEKGWRVERESAPQPAADVMGVLARIVNVLENCPDELSGALFAELKEARRALAAGALQAEHPLDALLPEICQLIDAVKIEWQQQGCWSEWDQSVRDRIAAYNIAKMKGASAGADAAGAVARLLDLLDQPDEWAGEWANGGKLECCDCAERGDDEGIIHHAINCPIMADQARRAAIVAIKAEIRAAARQSPAKGE